MELLTERFFNEFAIRVPGEAGDVLAKLEAKGVLGGVRASRLFGSGNGLDDVIICAATECTTDADIAAYASALKEVV